MWASESVFFYIIIVINILLIIRVIKVNFEIYEWQRATGSDVEQTRHCQWHLCVKQCKHATDNGVFVNAPLTVTSLMAVVMLI
jgi:hypothetical protein